MPDKNDFSDVEKILKKEFEVSRGSARALLIGARRVILDRSTLMIEQQAGA